MTIIVNIFINIFSFYIRETFLQLYRETDLQEEKDRILRAFSSVVDEDLVEEILRFTESVSISVVCFSV